MRNHINSALLLTMALLLSSCGGGGATSGDPLGTDTITISASVTSLNAGGKSIIKATVKKTTGTLVIGRSVTFSFRGNNSGGTIGIVNDETQGNGEAVAIYTAGANSPTNNVQDTIQAVISNDATDTVIITRVASAGGETSPTNLAVAAATSNQINLTWTASAGAAGYRIYKDGTYLKSVTTTSTSDTGLTANTQYCYAVSAYDSVNNESPQTGQLCATTNATPFPAPTGLVVTAASSTQINLSWTASAGATAYKIYRGGVYLKSVTTTPASDTGLTANTQYCYAVSAYDAANNESPRTTQLCATTYEPPPPVPTALTVSAVSPTRVDLSWAGSTGAAEYKIYRNGALLTSVAATLTSYSDTTASANTQYAYAITAIDAVGSESNQTAQAAQSVAHTGLTVPTGISATANYSTQITLAWSNSGGALVSGYKIYRNGAFLGATTATSLVDGGLTPTTQYCYRVSSTDSSGNESPQTSQVCATTYGPPPSVPTALTASAVSPTRVDLAWAGSAGASQYNIYRNGAPLATVAATATSYSDTTAVANTQYSYTIAAIDATNSESGQSTQSSAHTGLTVPSAVTVTVISKTQVTVSWTNSGGVNVAGYKLYRDGVLRQPVTTTSFTDTGVTPDTQYCYSVSSTDASGDESAKSSQICATTTNAAPGNPTGLVVNATSHSQIAVSWTASVGAAGYRIYRDGTKLSDATATSLADTGLTSSTQYCYAVSSYDSAGNESAQTAQLCATTQPAPPPVPPPVPAGLTATAVSQSQINLSWMAVASATGYALYRGGIYWTTVAGTTASDTGLTASTQYCYTITSMDSSGGASAQTSGVCVTTPTPPPPVPTGLTVTPVSASQLNIAWTASAGATGYKVYRDGVLLTTITATILADTGLSSGTTYCYMISAYNATGSESATGTQACAATDTIAVPTNLTVTAATSSQINLSWTASAGAAGYRIYKNGTYLKSVTTTSLTEMGLTADTTYCYSVSAFDVANNESAKTSQLCATTYSPPPAVPAGVTARVTAQNVGAGTATVSLSWTASAGASEYYVYRNGTKIVTGAPITGTSYSDATALISTSYTYTVVAVDATGSASNQSSQSDAYTGLMLPTLVSLMADSSAQITFTWSGGGTKQTGYKVYRTGASTRAMTATSLVDGGLTANTQYCYSVSATDAAGNESAQTSQLCATTYGAGSMVLSLTKSSDNSTTTSVSIDSPAKLTATVKDSAGSAIVGTVVSFSTISDLSFNPASGTALTDVTGKVTITVNAGNTTGATTIRAATTDASGTAISGGLNLSITPPNLSLSDLTITPAILSAGGSAGVSITVNDGFGVPFTTSVPISFTSDGVQASKATITPQVYTVNGVASATYRDINYATVDTITATLSIGGTTFTKTGTITVNAASAGSISFISATPANIALKGTGGTGRSETSVVVFKVLDTNGNPIRKTVNFSLLANTTVGGLALTAASADSDPVTGLVQTIVQAGTVSTPVRVSATIDTTTISTTSDQLVISTGIPDQDSFSIAASMLSIEGWNYNGTTSDITVRLADHFNNPVPDGTAVYFRSSGGSIQPSCTTIDGTCKVTFTSQAPRPANGRVRILAYALGEESFVDLNGNGIYDTTIPDTFTDMSEPFLDANENGSRDATEEFVDTNADGLYSPGDGIFNGILRDASISGPTTIHVRNSTTVVLSGSDAVIKIDGSTSPPAQNIPPCTNGVPWITGFVKFNVVVADENGNVMPAGTTISFKTTNGTIMTTPTTYEVPNTSTTTPAPYQIMIQSDSVQVGLDCVNSNSSGIFTVTVTTPTPNGISSYQYVTIND